MLGQLYHLAFLQFCLSPSLYISKSICRIDKKPHVSSKFFLFLVQYILFCSYDLFYCDGFVITESSLDAVSKCSFEISHPIACLFNVVADIKKVPEPISGS